MKNIFKQKLSILSMVLIAVGCLALIVMSFIPHGIRYTDMKDVEVGGYGVKIIYTFKGDTLRETMLYEDGEEVFISEEPYEINRGILYYKNKEIGKIDFYYIYVYNAIINGKKINTGYKCISSVLLKNVMLCLIAGGAALFVYSAYNTIKNKKNSPIQSEPETETTF